MAGSIRQKSRAGGHEKIFHLKELVAFSPFGRRRTLLAGQPTRSENPAVRVSGLTGESLRAIHYRLMTLGDGRYHRCPGAGGFRHPGQRSLAVEELCHGLALLTQGSAPHRRWAASGCSSPARFSHRWHPGTRTRQFWRTQVVTRLWRTMPQGRISQASASSTFHIAWHARPDGGELLTDDPRGGPASPPFHQQARVTWYGGDDDLALRIRRAGIGDWTLRTLLRPFTRHQHRLALVARMTLKNEADYAYL